MGGSVLTLRDLFVTASAGRPSCLRFRSWAGVDLPKMAGLTPLRAVGGVPPPEAGQQG